MAAVQALAARSLDPSAIVLGIGGPLEKADVQSSLDDLTRDWKSQAIRAERSTWTPAARSSSRLTTIDAPGVVGWIAVARAVSPVPEPDRPALAVAAEILNTRLNIATREIRGLSNRTSFEIPETADNSGLLLIRSAGRVEATAPLLKLSIDEVVRLRKPDDPIPDEELERAKGTLVLGRWQSALDGAREASATYAAETVRRGSVAPLLQWPDAVRAVSVPQVKDAVAKYLQLRDMAAVVVGPIEAIRQARHPRWPATLEESDAALQAAQ
jgi:predicted Zn-dependent peptidase